MEHKGTCLLESNRLTLRQFRLDDAEIAFKNWTSDEKVTEFLRWKLHERIDITREYIKTQVENYKNNNFYNWAIVLKSNNNEAIGTISVVNQNEDLNIAHIGYCIGSKWWHKGITSEAFSLVISFLFEKVKVNRIESQHDPRNINSGKVMIKCGLKYEGTLREADISNKGIVDASIYSILAKDYFKK